MSITIVQQPLDYTPSNGYHIYNVISTLSGATDFRYVFDVWVDPFNNAEKIARLKVAPNTTGNGIVDVNEVIRQYVKANPRYGDLQIKDKVGGIYGSFAPNGTIPFSSGGMIYSNGNNLLPDYEPLPHVAEYRILVGEQYTSGGTEYLSICSDPWVVSSEWTYGLESEFVPYPGSPTTVNIFDAGINFPSYGATALKGFRYLHQTNTGVFVASGSTTATTGSYTATLEPTGGDILTFTENSTGCRFSFAWLRQESGDNGWEYISEFCPDCENNPEVITTWPAVQDNTKYFNYNNVYWTGNTSGSENFKWWDKFEYKFQTLANITDNTPAKLLTTFKDDYAPYIFADNTGTETTIQSRHRSHHWQCPLIYSFFYRDFQSVLPGTRQPAFVDQGDGVLRHVGSRLVSLTTSDYVDGRIVYIAQTIQNVYTKNNIGFFISSSSSTTEASQQVNRISEAVVYKTYGDECISDPIHFLFLNQNGVWDTWTFDRKNIKSYSKSGSVYAQSGIRDNAVFNPLFSERRNVIYDQTVVESVEAQSHYVSENDAKIIEELFLSTQVYLMKDFYYDNVDADDYELTPRLIPIQITNTSLQEYKNRYNKLFQYTLTFEYNPLQQHRSNL